MDTKKEKNDWRASWRQLANIAASYFIEDSFLPLGIVTRYGNINVKSRSNARKRKKLWRITPAADAERHLCNWTSSEEEVIRGNQRGMKR